MWEWGRARTEMCLCYRPLDCIPAVVHRNMARKILFEVLVGHIGGTHGMLRTAGGICRPTVIWTVARVDAASFRAGC